MSRIMYMRCVPQGLYVAMCTMQWMALDAPRPSLIDSPTIIAESSDCLRLVEADAGAKRQDISIYIAPSLDHRNSSYDRRDFKVP